MIATKPSLAVLMAVQKSVAEVTRSSGLLPMGEVTGSGSNNNGFPCISEFQRQASAMLSSVMIVDALSKRVHVESLNSMLSSHTKLVLEGLSTIQRKLSDHHQGTS